MLGLVLAQGLGDSAYIRLKEQGLFSPTPSLPSGVPFPLTLPESDCSGAIRVCQSTYTYTASPPNGGTVSELGTTGRGTCLLSGERYSAWFIFTTQTAGTMGFLLCPGTVGSGGRDYDFAMWDVTGLPNPCAIFQGSGNVPPPIRCNYSGDQSTTTCCGLPFNHCWAGGLTGMDANVVDPNPLSYPASDPPIMPGIPVSAGQTFLLVISNFSMSTYGFTLQFTGTAQYFDDEPPRMDTIYRACSNSYDHQLEALTKLQVRFNELIDPSTVDADGSDFTLIDNLSGASIPILSAIPLNPPQTLVVELTTGQPLAPSRTYALHINYNDGTGGGPTGGTTNTPIADQCGNILPITNISVGGSADTFIFQLIDTLSIQLQATPPRCSGTSTGSISAQVNGGYPPYEYVLISGSSAVPPPSGWGGVSQWSGRAAGTYTLWIRDAVGCIQRRLIQLQDPPPLRLLLVDSLLQACGGQATGFVIVEGQGGTPPYEYRITPPSTPWSSNPSFSGLSTGTYTIEVRDSNRCTASRTIQVNVGNPIQVTLVGIDQAIECPGGVGAFSVQATGGDGSGNFSYVLLPLGLTNTTGRFTGIPAGTYTIQAIEPAGCYDTLQLTLSEPSPFRITDSSITPSTCREGADGQIQLLLTGGTPPYAYEWRDGNGNLLNASSALLPNLAPGSYTLTGRDSKGCAFGPFTYEVSYLYEAALREASIQAVGECPEERIVRCSIEGEGTPPLMYAWRWSDGYADSSSQSLLERRFAQTEGGTFSVRAQVLSAGKCIAEKELSVYVLACYGLVIPTAFTPNDDGVNDRWIIRAAGFQRYTLIVYNRWGSEIWTNGGDMTKHWEGRDKNGQLVPEGVYIFSFVGTDDTGREIRRTGTVTLLR